LRSAAHIASLLGILISLAALLGHLISTCSSSYSCYRLVTRYCAPERPWMWSRVWCRPAGSGPAPATVWAPAWISIVRQDGVAGGSPAPTSGDHAEAAELLFNTVCQSYVQLRDRHRWPAERARHGLRRLITPGLMTVPGPGHGAPVRDHERRAAMAISGRTGLRRRPGTRRLLLSCSHRIRSRARPAECPR
jgi:hypothetical protein